LALGVTLLIAFIGGILSFTSPCGFVILPVYLSYAFKEKKKSLFMTVAFCLGLILTFTILGVLIGLVNDVLIWKSAWKNTFSYIAGPALIFLGVITFMGMGVDLFAKKCSIIHVKNKSSFFEHFVLGIMFSFGWAPCAGAILSGIFVLTIRLEAMHESILMLLFYALGISLPLLILSYAADRWDWQKSRWFDGRKFVLFGVKTTVYTTIASLFLIIIGILMVLHGGTYLFMDKIPQLIPWTMDMFTAVNLELIESGGFLKNSVVNILGGILIVGVIGWFVRRAFKK
jgi:cytochrome c-type biogenesis protein